VGLIGASPERGWARKAHAPALRALPDFELCAIANRTLASARQAATVLGAAEAYGDVREMLASDIDLAVVTVRVPSHLALVTAALDAGKMVWCEWPLGKDLAETEAMAAHARRLGMRTVVGLQMRCAPAMRYMADLVAEGYLGEVLSVTLVGTGGSWGAVMEPGSEYSLDRRNGGTLLTVPCAHTLDGLCTVLGEFAEVRALEAQRRSRVALGETGKTALLAAPDQIAFAGRLRSGAVVSVHYRGGTTRGTNLLLELNGSEGDLRVTGGSGHGQLTELALEAARGDERTLLPLEVPAGYRNFPALDMAAGNVAEVYARFADDLRNGTRHTADFDHAVRRYKLVEAIERSAASGQSVRLQ
jgi:predicted dehydrogenase